MPPATTWTPPVPLVYPESDGLPIAENTKQFRWIVVLFGNLPALFHRHDDVFVAADLFWYPVEGQPEIRIAPDVLVVFGRPKGDRGSYRQWEEGGVPLTVGIEVLSPGSTFTEMDAKFLFYEEYGVEEYYVLDPEANHIMVYLRQGDVLQRVRPVQGFVSPRLGIRFEVVDGELVAFGLDGKRFQTFEEVAADSQQARQQARQQADQARQQAHQARQQAARLAELGRKARQGQASAAELEELDRLEQQVSAPPP